MNNAEESTSNGPPEKKPRLDSDDEDSQPEKQNDDKYYNKRQVGYHGYSYQLKILMIFIKRGLDVLDVLDGYSFMLGTECADAEKFDDLVFKSTYDNRQICRFLQAKHTHDESKKISEANLLAETDKGDYSIQKYFISYRKIKKKSEFNGSTNELKDFIIYTNIGFQDDLLNNFEEMKGKIEDEEKILDIKVQNNNKESKRLKFKRGDFPLKENLILVLEKGSVLKRLAKKIVALISKLGETEFVIKINMGRIGDLKEHISKLAGHVFIKAEGNEKKIRPGFLKSDTLPGNLNNFREELKTKLFNVKKCIQLSDLDKYRFKINIVTCTEDEYEKGQFNVEPLPNDEVTKEEIDEFLDKLVFAVNQPNDDELKRYIKDELLKQFDEYYRKNVYSLFHTEIDDWMKSKKGRYFSDKDGKVFFEKIKKELLGEITFNLKDPVESFTGRKEMLDKLHVALQRNQGNDKTTVISQLNCITGLGGIGKSELARKYAYDYKKDYDDNVIWINAEDYGTTKNWFFELADRLGICTEHKDGKQKSTESIVNKIYTFFDRKKSLFIFDNVEKSEPQEGDNENEDVYIKKFLPSSYKSNVNKPSFLLTSRNTNWGKINVIRLDTFTEEEAGDFIRKALAIESGQENKIKELVEELDRFPLALQQAVAYIKEEALILRRKVDINNYLIQYKQKKEELLGFVFPDDFGDSCSRTTFRTWNITIESIKKNRKYGQKAGEILDIIAYFTPDSIPIEIFLGSAMTNDDKKKIGYAVELLEKYSMVNSGQDASLLNVHRLVQQVTRMNLEKQKKNEKTLKEALTLLKQNLGKNNLYHAISAWDYASDEIVNIFYSLPKEIIEKLYDTERCRDNRPFIKRALKTLKKVLGDNDIEVAILTRYLGNAYGSVGKYEKKKELLKQALAILKERYGPNHHEVAKAKRNLGNAYGDLADLRSGDQRIGCYKEKKDLLEQALPILKEYYGSNHAEVAKAQRNLGNACGKLGYHKTKKELLEQALPILEECYGSNHVEVAHTQRNLGNACGKLGYHKIKKELLEQALPILEECYGPNHVKVAKARRNLGNACGKLGSQKTKKELLEKALPILVTYFGPDHVRVADARRNLGNACGKLGDHDRKKELLEQALPILEECYGPDHVEVAKARRYLDEWFDLDDSQEWGESP